MDERIKLAEAMGWEPKECDRIGGCLLKIGAKYCKCTDSYFQDKVPDPFTDANDDYAVLEWMRVLSETGMREDQAAWEQYAEALCVVEDGHDLSLIFNYKIGDYARAALKVIQNG